MAHVTRAARVKICSTIISSAPKHAKQVRQKYEDIERIMIVQKNSWPSWRKKSTAWKVTGSIRYPSPCASKSRMISSPTGMKRLKCVIPDSSGLDRLLRYETSLEHALDRTLGQLERLQRRRDTQKNIDIARQTTISE
jgi:hypothetical protein